MLTWNYDERLPATHSFLFPVLSCPCFHFLPCTLQWSFLIPIFIGHNLVGDTTDPNHTPVVRSSTLGPTKVQKRIISPFWWRRWLKFKKLLHYVTSSASWSLNKSLEKAYCWNWKLSAEAILYCLKKELGKGSKDIGEAGSGYKKDTNSSPLHTRSLLIFLLSSELLWAWYRKNTTRLMSASSACSFYFLFS